MTGAVMLEHDTPFPVTPPSHITMLPGRTHATPSENPGIPLKVVLDVVRIGGVSPGSLNNRQYLSGVNKGYLASVGPAEDATPTGGVEGIASSTAQPGKSLEGRSCNMSPPSSAKCWGNSTTADYPPVRLELRSTPCRPGPIVVGSPLPIQIFFDVVHLKFDHSLVSDDKLLGVPLEL
ncbi:hypothetical protein BHM03_00024713 [Ensete ventricosum]|nr:hypothetical protein BHM03_00024713 [Ensete ventricosum]